jgi:hypothetical protein
LEDYAFRNYISEVGECLQSRIILHIEHIGMINNGVEDTTSEEVKKWSPSHENYTFADKDGGTELSVDMDVADEYKTMFEEMWPKALQLLKELVEE